MPDWKLWREMAEGSLRSAEYLAYSSSQEDMRSAFSRYYYASYQAVTAMLHQIETATPPRHREAWSHEDTPRMVRLHLTSSIKNRKNRDTVISDLSFLYKLRVQSDYVSSIQSNYDLDMIAKKARFIIHIAEGVLSKGR